jgi:hypothetical protein
MLEIHHRAVVEGLEGQFSCYIHRSYTILKQGPQEPYRLSLRLIVICFDR